MINGVVVVVNVVLIVVKVVVIIAKLSLVKLFVNNFVVAQVVKLKKFLEKKGK